MSVQVLCRELRSMDSIYRCRFLHLTNCTWSLANTIHIPIKWVNKFADAANLSALDLAF